MIFLPECFDYLEESKGDVVAHAEPLTGPTITEYRGIASSHRVWLSLGGFKEKVSECSQ